LEGDKGGGYLIWSPPLIPTKGGEEDNTQYFNNLKYKQSLSPFGGGQRGRISKFGNLHSYLLQEGR
jgi:hypothetical protein